MIQIQLSNITLVLGAKRIFENLNWEIQRGQRIGLIGANGAGKSSLFKLIEGEHAPEMGGSITRARPSTGSGQRLITTGYLPQHPELDPTLTALDAAMAGNLRVGEVHAELEEVEASLGDPGVYGDEKKLQRALEK
ncbi:MAG: ABC transporter ATP-binding protein, partial [Chloroflexi bacterium CFX2]|nr:ABC transporter ATP-binding protein [Chloroflexi bacterium CFX2]